MVSSFKGVKSLMERIQKLSSQKVAVGVPKGTERTDSNGDEVDNADLVYIHTNGVRSIPAREEMQKDIDKGTKYSVALQMYLHEHGSMNFQVPPRPIIEPAIENAKEDLSEMLKNAALTEISGGNTKRALEAVGTEAQSAVRGWFTNPQNGWAPNSPETIKSKGSDKPLIDTGALRQSITYIIRDGDKDD